MAAYANPNPEAGTVARVGWTCRAVYERGRSP